MSATRECPHCGQAVRAGQTYCGECGEPLPGVDSPLSESQTAAEGAAGDGRFCPRCGIAISPVSPAVQCPSCGVPSHQECFAAQGGCAVVGCPSNPLTQAQVQAVPPAIYANYPPPPALPSGTNPWLIVGAVLGGLLAIGLIVVVILLAAGGPSSTSATTRQVAAIPITPISPGSGSNDSGGSAGGRSGSGANGKAQPPPPLNAAGVSGRDAQGYNIGAGCSDNPSSSQPGCADSPSTPSGDPEGTCAGGITIDRQTTSCPLAENVKAAYSSDGLVVAVSPERGRPYTFDCRTGGPGTTHMTICHGQAGNSPLYLRW